MDTVQSYMRLRVTADQAACFHVLQDITPSRKWQQVAVVLATLESIYG
jgi:hypothetical protein